MVESIGARLTTGPTAVVRAVRETPTVATAATAASQPKAVSTMAADMAAAPPVNTDRVAEIKQAIKDGRYPIMPARIADSLIALRLEWKSSNEPQS
ncbi:flagellar biosynthesis anti-sigma factor FlgM [Sphingomonas ginsenosidivorax]|uniref:Negative regulator of flagellin synthesis n=1 Tax=Sphingomonas ginsenosidivorax TaxID=862135 RepID=A0A5C6UJ06_9SPHN|nr:flagellar biosynthesis anti-sigma factor FlgM [Sphingomonas ginsenosidivorax]TXC72450.1 flagellar biosynthesis anti-sigma factor FlgM [Sphingomonas ginsenosidivorax]